MTENRLVWACCRVAMLIGCLAAWAGTGATEPPRFQLIQAGNVPAAWLSTGSNRLVYGSGTAIALKRRPYPAQFETTIVTRAPVTDALLSGPWLYLVEDGTSLTALDPDRLLSQPAEVLPTSGGRLRLARIADHLLVSEDGIGIRFVGLPQGPHAHHAHGSPFGPGAATFRLDGAVSAITGSMRTIYLAVEGQGLVVVDAPTPRTARIVRTVPLDFEVNAIGVRETEIYLLGSDGMRVLDLRSADPVSGITFHPQIRGSAMRVAGRAFQIAAGDRGLQIFRDRLPRAVLIPVGVTNNSFDEADLEIDVGDTVRWTNASGFHNVYSCIATQPGCANRTANETFGSGAPAGPIWVFSHTFAAVGSNRYVCQSHAPFMVGSVSVSGRQFLPRFPPDSADQER